MLSIILTELTIDITCRSFFKRELDDNRAIVGFTLYTLWWYNAFMLNNSLLQKKIHILLHILNTFTSHMHSFNNKWKHSPLHTLVAWLRILVCCGRKGEDHYRNRVLAGMLSICISPSLSLPSSWSFSMSGSALIF